MQEPKEIKGKVNYSVRKQRTIRRSNGNLRNQNIVIKIKNSLYELKSKLNIAERRVSELDDGS